MTSSPEHQGVEERKASNPGQELYASLPLASQDSLRLLRRLETPDPGLHYSLECHEFKECSSFLALSYTWGCPFLDEPRWKWTGKDTSHCVIYCNGQKVQISANLFDFLTNKDGLYGEEPTPAPLRVDALCINQADEDEKAVQIQRMAFIYGQASDVMVWLGPEASDDRSVLQLFQEHLPKCRLALGKDWPASDRARNLKLHKCWEIMEEEVWRLGHGYALI